jgi:hypothetical protein
MNLCQAQQWLVSIILTTEKVLFGRIVVQDSPGKKVVRPHLTL